jgi:hypothetical protein
MTCESNDGPSQKNCPWSASSTAQTASNVTGPLPRPRIFIYLFILLCLVAAILFSTWGAPNRKHEWTNAATHSIDRPLYIRLHRLFVSFCSGSQARCGLNRKIKRRHWPSAFNYERTITFFLPFGCNRREPPW